MIQTLGKAHSCLQWALFFRSRKLWHWRPSLNQECLRIGYLRSLLMCPCKWYLAIQCSRWVQKSFLLLFPVLFQQRISTGCCQDYFNLWSRKLLTRVGHLFLKCYLDWEVLRQCWLQFSQQTSEAWIAHLDYLAQGIIGLKFHQDL